MLGKSNCFFGIVFSLLFFGKLSGQTVIENNPPKPVVLIYSDPTNTVYFVSTGQEYLGDDLSSIVFDLSGRAMEMNDIKGGTSYGIFVGNLSTGIYFVQVKMGSETIANQKIIVQQK